MTTAAVFLLCLDAVVYAIQLGWKPALIWLAAAIAVYARGKYETARL